MDELQQTRYDQLIRRVGGLIGPGSKVSEVISELFPMIDVENVPGELLLLGGTRLCLGSAIITAAGGQFPAVQLFNPVNSGALITVSSITISPTATQTINYEVNATPLLATTASERFRDGRLLVAAVPTGQIRTDDLVAATNGNHQFIVQGNDFANLTDRNGIAVLSPGTGLEIGGSTAAGTILVNFNWRERVAERSELF